MPTSAQASDGRTRAMRVMIVDDHEISRAACRALLRAEGVNVVAALRAGDHAFAAARALRPEVVIVDVTPAADTGFDIARRLRALPDQPAVLVTSSANPSYFGRKLDRFRFVAKADISAAVIVRLARSPGREGPESCNP